MVTRLALSITAGALFIHRRSVIRFYDCIAWLAQITMFLTLGMLAAPSRLLVQGTTVTRVSRLLGVSSAYVPEHRPIMELDESTGLSNNLRELIVPYGSAVAGRAVVDLCLPPDSLIALISRGGRFIVPNGGTVLEEGDVLFILASDAEAPFVQRVLACRREDGGRCGCVHPEDRRKDN
jgi:cell volume regulation protein A